MVSAEEALAHAAERSGAQAQHITKTLDDTDQARADFIESNIDANIFKHFNGDAFVFDLPVAFNGYLVGTQGAVDEVKRIYEAGGWSVAVLPQTDGNKTSGYKLVFVAARRPGLPAPRVKPKSGLPALSTCSTTSQNAAAARLLVRFPTRGRPQQAVQVLQQYREMAGCAFTLEVIVDVDDETMERAEILQRLHALDAIVTVGEHHSKVEACNGGRVQDWDILMLASDDMVPVKEGWALRVIEESRAAWPHDDGAIFFNDGFQKSNLCTLPIVGRRLYGQFGVVYESAYKSLYCDREQTDVLKAMNRLVYVDEKIIEHRHHIWNRAEKDALYTRNDALETEDKATYERRREMRWSYSQTGFTVLPCWLSILICALPARRALRERLVDALYAQMGTRQDVEIIIDEREEITVGEKRQALLKKARGYYVAFVDDDDMVAHDYVDRVTDAVTSPDYGPLLSVDCASLVGVITTNGEKPQEFRHSIAYEGWYTKDGVHFRCPNHLNPIRRDLALQVGFHNSNVGEDADFSKRLRPLLQKEASTGDKPLYFYFYNQADSVQSTK